MKKDYWLVRTQSGHYYDDFFLGGFIGVGWNELDWNKIINEGDEEVTLDYISDIYTEEKQPKRILSQLSRFTVEMKEATLCLFQASRRTTYLLEK